MGMNTPYKPITKEAAAELLSVSKRTIDNWISDGKLPMPTSIGRRVYWHPDVFRAWEDRMLGVQEAPKKSHESKTSRGRPRAQLH